jgi:hypothetical protein
MYAFWKYDLFPYLLWGEVVGGPDSAGRVQAKGFATSRGDGTYGGGWVDPVYLVETEAGKRIALEINQTRRTRSNALGAIKQEYRNKLEAVLPQKLVDALPK